MTRRTTTAALTLAGTLIGPVALAPPASAAACTGAVRYSASSNTIYLAQAGTYTPTSIVATCASAPLKLTDAAARTWLLSADLVLQNGARLDLHGSAAGGDVDTLRLRSRSSNSALEVSALTAQYGHIDARNVTVTSWDDEADAPDTKADYVTGGRRGRAFVRAISYADATGTHQSRLDIADSTFTQLGYYASEAYGISYKSRQCSRDTPAACASAPATGSQTNSTFTGNFMGVYLWGASHMTFTGNRYGENTMYGWDGHDVSTDMTISGNRFDHNGDHGWICSQRCDSLTVKGNRADHNGMVPWSGPDPEAESSGGQVHGLMLHRGVTNTVLADNVVEDNPSGAGIAVFDTAGARVTGNTISRAKYGVRLSVGAKGNRFERNTITDSGRYAVYSYRGSDAPTYTDASGRPSDNAFVDTRIAGSGSSVVKLGESDAFTFTGTTWERITTAIELTSSLGIVFDGALPTKQALKLRGTSASPTSVTVTAGTGVKVSKDAFSTATLR